MSVMWDCRDIGNQGVLWAYWQCKNYDLIRVQLQLRNYVLQHWQLLLVKL